MYVAEKIYYEAFWGLWVDVCKAMMPDIKKSEDNMLAVCGTVVLKRCFLKAYTLQYKIETLPEAEKTDLWNYIKEKFPGKTRGELIENAKVIYTISKMM